MAPALRLGPVGAALTRSAASPIGVIGRRGDSLLNGINSACSPLRHSEIYGAGRLASTNNTLSPHGAREVLVEIRDDVACTPIAFACWDDQLHAVSAT